MVLNSELKEDDFAFVYLDVDQLPIAWLAYRGVINSCDVQTANPSNLSFFLMDVVQRGLDATLRREGVLEPMRVKDYPAVQYHDLDGPAYSQCAPVLCAIRTGSHLRTHPGQDCRLKAEGSLGRRSPAPWL